MRQDSVSKDSASIANRVFKKVWAKLQNDYVITPSEVYTMQGLFVKYERATGASPTNTIYNSLIDWSL